MHSVQACRLTRCNIELSACKLYLSQVTKAIDISWSRLIAIAPGDFVRWYRGRKELTDRINMAYADAPDAEEAKLQEGMRATQRRLVEGEW